MLDDLRQGLRKVELDGRAYFLAEGDLLLTEEQLEQYAATRQAQEDARRAAIAADASGLAAAPAADGGPRGLVGVTQGGKHVRWRAGTELSYRVMKETFGKEDHYDLVVENMKEATRAWELTCGVRFHHLEDLDTRPGSDHDGALFTVGETQANGRFIAVAFFPNDPPARRRVWIDPSYYQTSFDEVGVLRHELGHVLGFRHEHIVSHAPPACPDEPMFDAVELTEYDPQSVMHYFCGNRGSRQLAITKVDVVGAQRIYGPPLDLVREIDP